MPLATRWMSELINTGRKGTRKEWRKAFGVWTVGSIYYMSQGWLRKDPAFTKCLTSTCWMNETINQPWINKWMSCPKWSAVSRAAPMTSPFLLELSTHKYFPWQQSPQVNDVTLPVGHGRSTHLRRLSLKGMISGTKMGPFFHLRCHRRRLSPLRSGWGEESSL